MHCAPPACPAFVNVVALGDVLATYGASFQVAVCQALLQEGFEFGSELPNLQLARELRESVAWSLDDQGFEQELATLQAFLDWADQRGVLVDVSLAPELCPTAVM